MVVERRYGARGKRRKKTGARSGWCAVQCASVGTRLREPPLLQSEREQRARREEWGKHHACLHWPVVRIVRAGAGMRSAFFDASGAAARHIEVTMLFRSSV